jgi:hypothetical protein
VAGGSLPVQFEHPPEEGADGKTGERRVRPTVALQLGSYRHGTCSSKEVLEVRDLAFETADLLLRIFFSAIASWCSVSLIRPAMPP